MVAHRRVLLAGGAGLAAVAVALGIVGVRNSPDPPTGHDPVVASPSPAERRAAGLPSLRDPSRVVVMAAGDIASGGSWQENARATGDLVRAGDPDRVLTLGDNAYPDGTPQDYAAHYAPTWGSFRSRTLPVPGNHDYHRDPPSGYVGYFGPDRVTNRADGQLYYARDLGGGWRVYAMNTELDTAGAQLQWLRSDVAAHPASHYVLAAHSPRYTSGEEHDPSDDVCPLWDELAGTGRLEIVLAGHQHDYERFAPMDCHGHQTGRGARSFVVGAGGGGIYGFRDPEPGSQARNDTDFGVLRLVLRRASYSWSYLASGRGWDGEHAVDTGNAGEVLDSGRQATHGPG